MLRGWLLSIMFHLLKSADYIVFGKKKMNAPLVIYASSSLAYVCAILNSKHSFWYTSKDFFQDNVILEYFQIAYWLEVPRSPECMQKPKCLISELPHLGGCMGWEVRADSSPCERRLGHEGMPLCVMPFHCNNFIRFGKIVWFFAFFVLHPFQVVVLPPFITFEPLDGFFNFKKVNGLEFWALFNETHLKSLHSPILYPGAMNFMTSSELLISAWPLSSTKSLGWPEAKLAF